MISWDCLVWCYSTSGHRSVLYECVKDNKTVRFLKHYSTSMSICALLLCAILSTVEHIGRMVSMFIIQVGRGVDTADAPPCAPPTLPWVHNPRHICGSLPQASSCVLCLRVRPHQFLHSHVWLHCLWKSVLLGTTGSSLKADGGHWVKALGSLSFSGQLWDGLWSSSEVPGWTWAPSAHAVLAYEHTYHRAFSLFCLIFLTPPQITGIPSR